MPRSVPIIRLFGYGALANPLGVGLRLGHGFVMEEATLQGYRRSFTKPGRTHLYLTLCSYPLGKVRGLLIDCPPSDFALLARPEHGYNLLEITDSLENYPEDEPRVYCFIAPSLDQIPVDLRRIRRSYIAACTSHLSAHDQVVWREETHIPPGVTIDEDEE